MSCAGGANTVSSRAAATRKYLAPVSPEPAGDGNLNKRDNLVRTTEGLLEFSGELNAELQRHFEVRDQPPPADFSYIDVRDSGAIGDGVTDDTVAIQAALDAAEGESIIYFPPGHNFLCGDLTLPPDRSRILSGYGSAITHAGPDTLFTFAPTQNSPSAPKEVIEGLTLWAGSQGTGKAIRFVDTSNSIFRDMFIFDFSAGIEMYNEKPATSGGFCENHVYSRVTIQACGIGMHFTRGPSGGDSMARQHWEDTAIVCVGAISATPICIKQDTGLSFYASEFSQLILFPNENNAVGLEIDGQMRSVSGLLSIEQNLAVTGVKAISVLANATLIEMPDLFLDVRGSGYLNNSPIHFTGNDERFILKTNNMIPNGGDIYLVKSGQQQEVMSWAEAGQDPAGQTYFMKMRKSVNDTPILEATRASGGFRFDGIEDDDPIEIRAIFATPALTAGNGDTSPDVSRAGIVRLSNTAPTTITNFNWDDPVQVGGEVLSLKATNGNNTIQHGSGINLAGDIDYRMPTNAILRLQSIDGAWEELSRTSGTYIVNVRDKGAVGNGTTDDAAAIQSAIDDVAAFGGMVFFPRGTYAIGSTLSLPSGVYLEGESRASTTLFLMDTRNIPMLDSAGFSMLTGQNKWFVGADNVPWGFGIVRMQIDGNRDNNAAGDGVRFYGKSYLIYDVLIRDCAGIGLCSEAGTTVGQADFRDMPESIIGPLWVRNCGSHGVLYRGPHDGNFTMLHTAYNSGDGFRSERSATYDGFCKVGFLHGYANTGLTAYIDAAIHVYGEILLDGQGMTFTPNADNSPINLITKAAGITSGTAVDATGTTGIRIGALDINVSGSANGLLAGNDMQVGRAFIFGGASTGVGLQIYGNGFSCPDLFVREFDGTGGIGIELGTATVPTNTNNITGRIANNSTDVKRPLVGNGNWITLDLFEGGAGTVWDGVPPGELERIDFIKRPPPVKKSRERLVSLGGQIDLTLTTEQQIVLPHNLLWTPLPQNCSASLHGAGGPVGWAMDYFHVSSSTATDVTVKFKLGTAAASGTLDCAVEVRFPPSAA